MTLIYVALAWLAGIVLADQAPFTALWPLVAATLAAAGSVACRRRPRARTALLALCACALGAARLAVARPHPAAGDIVHAAGSGDRVITGSIVEDPQRTEDGQRVLLRVETILRGERRQQASGLLLVSLPRYPERRYGDRLELRGAVKLPREADRPGAFDYRAYLARRDIFALSEPKAVRLIAAGQGQPARLALLDLRDRCRRVLLRELPEPQASLAVGILLGLQSSIPDDVSTHFSVTGTSHILVISGWNITIIATALYAVTERLRLPRGAAFWATLATIWLYTLFVGATATVIRAAVMGSIVIVGQRLSRPAHAWTTLLAACMAMTLVNPQTLWDLGFELSALATASLFAYGKGTEALLLRTPLRASWLGWAREALTATLAAQILALPLILYNFGNLSLIAPVANVALLPMVPYAMLFGALALVGGLVALPLGQALGLPAYVFLAWLTEGARRFAEVPFAAVQLPPFPLWALLLYYAVVLGAWLWRATLADTRGERLAGGGNGMEVAAL
jgi:competence protein ComEC